MKKVSLSGSRRANVGKKDASELRSTGKVPCVVYGGKEQVPFSVLENDLRKIVWNPNVYQIDLNIDGTVVPSIIQDIQFHPVTDKVRHIDFLELIPGKPVKVKLPVRLTGASEGVKKGGKLLQNFRKITAVGSAETLPDAIEVNVDNLNIGDMVRVKDISIEGVKLMELPEAVVAAVKITRNVAAADANAPAEKEKK